MTNSIKKMQDVEEVKTIAIIGAGQIGSRHLQALAKIDIPVILQVVDPNENSLEVARNRYLEIPANENVRQIDFFKEINSLQTNIDLCIIATSADVRFKVFQELVQKKKVSNVVFEKVVFQSEQQFKEAHVLIQQNNISCWVNCMYRTFARFGKIKKMLAEDKNIFFKVFGGEWGIACNGIHYIDLLVYLSDDNSYKLDITNLDPHVIKSKRVGVVEVTGKVIGTFSKGSRIEFEAIAGSSELKQFFIKNSQVKINTEDDAGTEKIAKKNNNWKEEATEFRDPFQSELTHLIAKEIFKNGTCPLPDFSDSYLLHLPFLDAIKKHIETVTNKKYDCCPIT